MSKYQETWNKKETEKKEKLKTFGRTRIVKKEEVKGGVQDVDYEEIN